MSDDSTAEFDRVELKEEKINQTDCFWSKWSKFLWGTQFVVVALISLFVTVDAVGLRLGGVEPATLVWFTI